MLLINLFFYFINDARERRNLRLNGKEEAQKCEQCEFKTTSKALLNKHKEAVHKSSLEQHTQEMRKRQKCEQCDFKSSSIAHLNSHKNSAHEKHIPSCDQCDYKAPSRTDLRSHMETKQNDKTQNENESNENGINEHTAVLKKSNYSKRLHCEYCARKFNKEETYMNHRIKGVSEECWHRRSHIH